MYGFLSLVMWVLMAIFGSTGQLGGFTHRNYIIGFGVTGWVFICIMYCSQRYQLLQQTHPNYKQMVMWSYISWALETGGLVTWFIWSFGCQCQIALVWATSGCLICATVFACYRTQLWASGGGNLAQNQAVLREPSRESINEA